MSFEEKLDQFRTERDAIDELSASGGLTAADERQARESLASKFSGEASAGDTLHDQPHPPVHPGLTAATEPLPPPGILAARCPPGWNRDPMTGRPVMPCLGKLLFPCEPDEVPTHSDFHAQCAVCRFDPVVEWLVLAVLTNAIDAKNNHNKCMHLYDEGAVSLAVDAALRSKGTIRIVKTAAGWEEIP